MVLHGTTAARCDRRPEGRGHARRLPGSRSCPAATPAMSWSEKIVGIGATPGDVPVIFIQEVHKPLAARFRPRARRGRDGPLPRGRSGDRARRRARPPARRVPDPQAPLLGLLRDRARPRPPIARRIDADPRRRADRRLRPLHVRRCPPARLPLPGRDRLRRRVLARAPTTPRCARWSTSSATAWSRSADVLDGLAARGGIEVTA